MLALLLAVGAALAANTLDGTVDPGVTLGDGITVEAGAWVGAGAILGDNVIIRAGATIAPRARVGHDTIIGADSVIGRRAVIGADCDLPRDSVVSRAAFIGDDVKVTTKLSLGYAVVVGRGVRADELTMGNLSALGGNGAAGETAISCPVLRVGRGAMLAVQAPYTLLCDDVGGVGVFVGPDASVEPEATLGGGSRLRRGAHVGQRAVVADGCVVGRDACVGDSADVEAGAVLREGSRLGQDVIFTDAILARGAEAGTDAASCGVWPDGAPVQGAADSDGYPTFSPSPGTDADPGSRPALVLPIGAACTGPGDLYAWYLAGGSTIYGGPIVRVSGVDGSVSIAADPVPEVRSMAFSDSGAELYVGYGWAGTYGYVDANYNTSVWAYTLPTLAGTKSVDLLPLDRTAVGMVTAGASLLVMTEVNGQGPTDYNHIHAYDRSTFALTETVKTFGSYEGPEWLVADDAGNLYWSLENQLYRRAPDGTETTRDPAGDDRITGLAVAGDGTVFYAASIEPLGCLPFEPWCEPIHQVWSYDWDTDSGALLLDPIDDYQFRHLDVACDGTVAVAAVLGSGRDRIYGIGPDGAASVLYEAPQDTRLGIFALAPQ